MTQQANVAIPKCRLCKDNDASSVGSHIFNRELINWFLNEEGEDNLTDREAAFTIIPGIGVTTYFGRKISLKKVEEILGRPITDEELEENKTRHTYVKKHFLCLDCEARLSRVESYFMDNVYARLKANACPLTILMPDLSMAACENIDRQLVRLYIYSLVWRAAESKISGCKFKPKHIEFLRSVLDTNLHTDIRQIINNGITNRDEINKLALIISYLTTTDEPQENFIHVDPSLRPYFLVIGDLVVQLFFKEQWVKSHVNYLFGMFRFQKATEIVNIGSDEPIKIGVVSEDFRKDIVLANYWGMIARIEYRCMEQDIIKGYKMFFKEKPHPLALRGIAREALLEYNDDTVPIGIRYTPERRMNIYTKKFEEIARLKGYQIE